VGNHTSSRAGLESPVDEIGDDALVQAVRCLGSPVQDGVAAQQSCGFLQLLDLAAAR